MWREISKYGRKLVEYGLTYAHFGNISVRLEGSLLITCRGSMLDELDESMMILCSLDEQTDTDSIASSETVVHRCIYRQSSARAIIHVHSPFAVAFSLLTERDYLAPQDSESRHFLHRIPLVTGDMGSAKLAANMAGALSEYKVAIARGHGTFATGTDLKDAYVCACSAEHACKVYYLYMFNKIHQNL